MKNYDTYQVEDFFQDLYFRKWVLEELPPDDTFWPGWQASHPWQAASMEEAKALILAFRLEEMPADPVEVQSAIEAILAGTRTAGKPIRLGRTWLRACASVVLLLGVFFWIRTQPFTNRNKTLADGDYLSSRADSNSDKIANRTGKVRKLVLKDGSTVLLDTGSTLRISGEFGQDRREVFLEGEAVFDVARDSRRPFLVHTGELVTKVLGTRFRVRGYTGEADVHVAVQSGKVTVFKNRKTPGSSLSEEIILTPNQQAVYLKSDHTIIKTIVPRPMALRAPVRFRNFEYDESPIPQVLNDLEEVYGVKILFDDQMIKECNLTARLTDEPLFVKLTMICETIQARYEIIDGQIVISGGGCQ